MQVNQTNLYELTRKATDLMTDTQEIARLLKARLGADHDLSHSAHELQASLETLAHELRCFSSENRAQIDVSEDT